MRASIKVLTCVGFLIGASQLVEAGSPKLSRITPPGGQRGTTAEVYFNGKLPLIGLGLGREQGNVAAPREYGVTITRRF